MADNFNTGDRGISASRLDTVVTVAAGTVIGSSAAALTGAWFADGSTGTWRMTASTAGAVTTAET